MNEPLTSPEQRAAWAALLDAASPGRWKCFGRKLYSVLPDGGAYDIGQIVGTVEDKALIVAAPEAMRRLLLENDALRAQLAAPRHYEVADVEFESGHRWDTSGIQCLNCQCYKHKVDGYPCTDALEQVTISEKVRT